MTFIRRYLFSHAKCGVFHTVPPSVFSRVDMFHTIAPTRSNPDCQLHVEDVSHFIYLHICVVAMASYIVKLDDNLFCTSQVLCTVVSVLPVFVERGYFPFMHHVASHSRIISFFPQHLWF